MHFAQRLQTLANNVFADMDRAKAEARASGKTIIDLSLGSSDLPVCPEVIATIERALHDPSTHGYLLHQATQPFRQSVAKWYEKRFGISLDAETEVLPLIGSQEGTAHLPLAVLNPGEFALLLDPGYPSHYGGVALAGGQIYGMPLTEDNKFLPVFGEIPDSIREQARMMILNYPHNPTGAIAPLSFFQEAVSFCDQHQLVLVHDFPYFDIYFAENEIPPSILQADPAKTLSIEFLTFSKSYNMGGFRIGFAVGNRELIGALRKIKAIVDFNQYRGILAGAIAALEGSQAGVKQTVRIFQKRRDALIAALESIGWQVSKPKATLYVWAKLPPTCSQSSVDFCTELVKTTGVALSPGAGFGKSGEGYVRFALVQEPPILEEAVARIGRFLS